MYNEINNILGTSYTSDDEIDWIDVSSQYPLTEDFIRTYKDYVNWFYILRYQKLSEPFITEVLNEGYLEPYGEVLSTYQRLSTGFIKEHKDFLSDTWWRRNLPKLSYDEVIQDLEGTTGYYWWPEMPIPIEAKDYAFNHIDKESNLSAYTVALTYWKNNYVAQHTPQQTKEILESFGYECYGDYFIAYKGIKANRYPKFNFSRQYNVGETYEDACYVGPGLYGPGICVSTREEAERYCNELIIRCEVRYEDVGAVLKDGLFMRCFKIKVLSDVGTTPPV